MPSIASRPNLLRIALVAVGACGVAIVYWFDPVGAAWYPKCPFHLLTGWHCPGCGSSRAAHALLHGDLQGALAYNSLVVCAAPLLLAFSIAHVVSHGRWSTHWTTRLSPRWIWLVVAALAAFTVLRNIPAYPFNLLAPH
jgi:hypothetical protein